MEFSNTRFTTKLSDNWRTEALGMSHFCFVGKARRLA
jgi:hypothetical protein